MSESDNPSDSGEVNRIQRWFQAVVTHPDGVHEGLNSTEAQRLIDLGPGELERVVTRSRSLSAAERLAIYANAYHTRLLECLGDVFPMLKRTLGEEAFGGFAFGYLQDYPSRSYTLNELGRHFPAYLEETRPTPEECACESESPNLTEDWPDFLIDLARIEWVIYDIFDGPGTEGQALLKADDLFRISPDRWPSAKLQPVPCLQVLATRFPVNGYYTDIRRAKEGEVIRMPSPRPSFVALTRRDFIVRRYELCRPEFVLLEAILQGHAVGPAIERAAEATDDDMDGLASRLNGWFRKWTSGGFFESVKEA